MEGDMFRHLFFEKFSGILSCEITSKKTGAFVDGFDGNDAVVEFDRLVGICS